MTTRSKRRAETHEVQQILAAHMTLLREHADLLRLFGARLAALERLPPALEPEDPHRARDVNPHLGRF